MKLYPNKKFLAALGVILTMTILLICLPMSGYGKPIQRQQHIKIGVSVYKISDTFLSSIMSQMEQMSKDYEKSTG
ncbi:MAG: hypothetical protein RRY54_07410, partial [Angelakisella sp.]